MIIYTFRVKTAEIAKSMINEFVNGDETYTINEYIHAGKTVYDVVCDEIIEMRIVVE